MSRKWRTLHISCIILLFLVLSLFHYIELLAGTPIIDNILSTFFSLGLSRHAIERFIYPLLVIYASWILGIKSGGTVWLASALAILPRALVISPNPIDAIAESVAALVISGLAIVLIQLYRRSQKQQEALTLSQRNYETLFNNASDAIWVHDLEGKIIIANPACEKLSGYTISELSGMDVSKFLSPESLLLAREVRYKLVSGETPDQRYEQYIIRKDKTKAIVELATQLVKVNDKPTAFQHIARDVTDERDLRESLHVQIQKTIMAQEEERKRIARELHDDIAQSILLISRRIDILMSRTSCNLSKSLRNELEYLYGLSNEIYKSLQRYSRDLRPSILDQMGLVAALNWLTNEISIETGVNAEVKASKLPALSPEKELVMYRIAQEALNNVRKHAEASKVNIILELDTSSKLKMTITDNGKGFSMPRLNGELVKENKLGLLGMTERARLIGGSLNMKSELGKGTSIIVEVPV